MPISPLTASLLISGTISPHYTGRLCRLGGLYCQCAPSHAPAAKPAVRSAPPSPDKTRGGDLAIVTHGNGLLLSIHPTGYSAHLTSDCFLVDLWHDESCDWASTNGKAQDVAQGTNQRNHTTAITGAGSAGTTTPGIRVIPKACILLHGSNCTATSAAAAQPGSAACAPILAGTLMLAVYLRHAMQAAQTQESVRGCLVGAETRATVVVHRMPWLGNTRSSTDEFVVAHKSRSTAPNLTCTLPGTACQSQLP